MISSRKGISPLVATVLLIAFTISVGAIVGAWVTGFSKGKSDDLTRSAGATIECASASINFDKTDIGTTKIAIVNDGGIELDEFKITVQNGTGETLSLNQYTAAFDNAGVTSLKPGDKAIIKNDSMSIDAGETVTVTSVKCVNAQHTVTK